MFLTCLYTDVLEASDVHSFGLPNHQRFISHTSSLAPLSDSDTVLVKSARPMKKVSDNIYGNQITSSSHIFSNGIGGSVEVDSTDEEAGEMENQ